MTTEISQVIEEEIDRLYSLYSLKRIYCEYLYQFDLDNFKVLNKNTILKRSSTLKKADHINILNKVFSDKDHFKRFLKLLPQHMKKIFYHFVWEGDILPINKFEEKFKVEVLVDPELKIFTSPITQNIKTEFLLFGVKKSGHFDDVELSLFLGNQIRELIKDCFSTPFGYNLTPYSGDIITDYIFSDENEILSNLDTYIAYTRETLKIGKNSKVSIPEIRKMQNFCKIDEFYPDNKELKLTRTKLLISFLEKVLLRPNLENLDKLKEFFNDLFETEDFYSFDYILDHLKGLNNYRNYSNTFNQKILKVNKNIYNLYQSLPENEWISIENIFKHVRYKNVYLKLLELSLAKRYVYFQEGYTYPNGFKNSVKAYINSENYEKVIIEPLLNSSIFLLASFGLIDLAYDLPKNEKIQSGQNDYLTIYDGIKYIKLNSLGAYVLQKNDNFDYVPKKKVSKLSLDENRLIINIVTEDNSKHIILSKFANKVNENFYEVNYDTFFQNCITETDILERIALFNEEFPQKLPDVWHNFLLKVTDNLSPFSIQEELVVLKLSEKFNNDKELFKLLANDEVLIKLVQKVENFQIAVSKNDLDKLKNRLKTFGYLITEF